MSFGFGFAELLIGHGLEVVDHDLAEHPGKGRELQGRQAETNNRTLFDGSVANIARGQDMASLWTQLSSEARKLLEG